MEISLTKSFNVRRAKRADLAAIVELLADDALGTLREKRGPPLHPRYEQAFDAIDNDPNPFLVVAEADGRVVGCLQLSFVPGLSRVGMRRGQIESVRVASSMRGSGLGRQILDWAIEECRSRGCGLVQLTTDKSRADALRFYESIGFISSHEGLKLQLSDTALNR